MNSLGMKILFIFILIISLLIPVQLVNYLITERQERKYSMMNEISQSWGQQQIIQSISCYDNKGRKYTARELSISGKLDADIRYKGIFSIPFYTTTLNVSGTIEQAAMKKISKVKIVITDTTGLEIQSCKIGGTTIPYNKQKTTRKSVSFILPDKFTPQNATLSIDMTVNGIDSLQFSPLAEKTTIVLSSNWPSPSFMGNRLPAKRNVTDDGFEATWIAKQGKTGNMQGETFGISLFVPVDIYKLTDRSIKYALLFITLTFLVFFLFEILNKMNIHIMQYTLVGIALTVFYLLLLALSEHIAFLPAYIIATISTVSLVSLYCKKILNNTTRSLIVTGVLILLYTFLLTLLMLEKYSLLLGSFGLFLILTLVMYTTRNINWYEVSKKNNNKQIK